MTCWGRLFQLQAAVTGNVDRRVWQTPSASEEAERRHLMDFKIGCTLEIICKDARKAVALCTHAVVIFSAVFESQLTCTLTPKSHSLTFPTVLTKVFDGFTSTTQFKQP